MFDISKTYDMKIIAKSARRNVVRLRGEIKTNRKIKKKVFIYPYIFVTFSSILMYQSAADYGG